MAEKPAQVILQFDRTTEGFWSGLIEVVDQKTVREVSNITIALIPVKSYGLASINNGKELVVLIPRRIVMAIVEGVQAELSGFLSGKSTSKKGPPE
jgi:hypothetical protein